MGKYNPPEKAEIEPQDERHTASLERTHCRLELIRKKAPWKIYQADDVDQIPNEFENTEIFFQPEKGLGTLVMTV